MKIFNFEDWDLTQLKDVVVYDPKTGKFKWLVKPSARVALGQQAGSLSTKGYRYIGIAGKVYQAHRLAWFYVYGEFPKFDLDHINRKPDDNRISNLREATKVQNGGNSKVRKDGRLKGAYWHRREEKWWSTIDGKWLGYYATEKEAHSAYCKAAKLKYGNFFFSG